MERLKRGRVESASYEQKHPDDCELRVDYSMQSCSSNVAHMVDSASILPRAGRAPHHAAFLGHKDSLIRPKSAPNLTKQTDDKVISRIFPDICPRELRIAEIKLWNCPWMDKGFLAATFDSGQVVRQLNTSALPPQAMKFSARYDDPDVVSGYAEVHSTVAENAAKDAASEVDKEICSLKTQLSLEEKLQRPVSPADTTVIVESSLATPTSCSLQWKATDLTNNTIANRAGKRPLLRLKLEDMPTPQQAEERAQRAATRLIAKRDALEAAAMAAGADSEIINATDDPSAAQQAMIKLNFSSDSDSDFLSPSERERHSAGSAYSPNHGMFTTKSVAISEAGISSPDAACLHLQENLERVNEIGRGASGVVHKAIHIPTLKVVAVKDVPVYGRGQRRQMVRELHALYSNLVPMADNESPNSQHPAPNSNSSKPNPRYVPTCDVKVWPQWTQELIACLYRPSPYIVSFYDAFVDRPKNSICMVMEYMNTGSLQDIVLRGGCQNEKVIARLANGVLHGLAHIHNKRMVHRDIKPHNLLTNRKGDVKISDFGLARTLNDNFTSTKTFVGTLLYMAPERIGGGDYSYPADIWSFGLALTSVALGRYPLPTQDGFFGLVDYVSNEHCLKLPIESFSDECRSFLDQCLIVNPNERPSAETLLQHPFLDKYTSEQTVAEWKLFIDKINLCEERNTELESLSEAVYRHMYEHSVKISHLPQSDFGVSFVSQATPTFSRRQISLQPVQKSLQLGLANYLHVPVHVVHEKFEEKRCYYSDKLLEDYCYSPQSWTASPGISRRQQFGIETDSPQRTPSEKGSFWRKLQDSMAKLGQRKRRNDRRSSVNL